jgi:hypothetical protein
MRSEENMRSKALGLFRDSLKRIEGETLLDVACGEGLYSFTAANLGYKVSAIDGREDRVPLQQFKTQGIAFKKGLVEEAEFNYDIVLLSGIFYHLDLTQQLNLLHSLSESSCKSLIINTHVVNGSSLLEWADRFVTKITFNGIEGSIYREGKDREKRPMASITNYFSFWHTEKSLIDLFNKFGFSISKIGNLTDNRNFYTATKL